MTRERSNLFYQQDYIIIDGLYPDSYLNKIKPYLTSIDYELFFPPNKTDSHMHRSLDKKTMAKVVFMLINEKLLNSIEKALNKKILWSDIRLTKYTAANKDSLSFHSDFDRKRIAGFSIDLTFSQNCNAKFELLNTRTDEIILSHKAGTPGRLIVFRIDEYLNHRVTPTTQDDRYALTGWLKKRV